MMIQEMMNMSIKLQPSVAEAHPDEEENSVDDSLVEQVWRELDGQLPRKRVGYVVSEVALDFENATVKAYLQILVHRRALERLRQELNQMDTTKSHPPDEQF